MEEESADTPAAENADAEQGLPAEEPVEADVQPLDENALATEELLPVDEEGSPPPEQAGTEPGEERRTSEEDEARKPPGEEVLEADFFEKGEEKPQSVEAIAGMTEVTEEPDEEETVKAVEGKAEEKVGDKEKVGDEDVVELKSDQSISLKDELEREEDQDLFKEKKHKEPKHIIEEGEGEAEERDKIKESISKYEAVPTEMMSRRRSMKSKSIAYDVLPRISSDQDLAEMFDLNLDEDKQIQLYDYDDDKEEEEEVEEEEEEVPPLDREPYYEKHEIFTKQIAERKIRNFILQKKLAIFFKRRKMEHVLKETADQQFETIQNYGRKLDTYGELLELDERERARINGEIEANRKHREVKFVALEKIFVTMQNREKDIGTGLINTKTGNAIPDKLVERFIRRQKQTMDQVCSMRLNFIKLKGMVQEKLDAIAALDKIGENLYLIDYEQLKMENRSHADKIEERDEELTRLRAKCQNIIQILAHIREKSAALETDLEDLQDDLSYVQEQATQIRESLNYTKQRRDYFRHATNKIREESGLLTQPALLEDMEKSMIEVNSLSEELDNLLEEHKVKANQIRNIRKHIEIHSEGYHKKEQTTKSKSRTKINDQAPQIYKGRPCLYMPTLPKNAFDHLKDVKPRPANLPKKKRG